MNFIDNFLNNITMYRLVLYYLIALVAIATVASFFGLLPFNGLMFLFTVSFVLIVAWLTNTIFGLIFETTTNLESVYISGLILVLIIPPMGSFHDLGFLFWGAVWICASKFILAVDKKHLFNPVALAVFLTSLMLGQSANWWVGNGVLFLPVLIGGLLIMRKIRRTFLVLTFIATALVGILISGFIKQTDLLVLMQRTLMYSPLLFLGFVMLTEPATTPPRKWGQIFYGLVVGILYNPAIHIQSLYTTPESALLIGNLVSFFISPLSKRLVTFKQKVTLAKDTLGFIFTPNKPLAFLPGQYVEWTLSQKKQDSRGNRRYFTIASSPTEPDIQLGVKYYPNPSQFKQALNSLSPDTKMMIGSLSGDFTLPDDQNKKLVFIAGGIGVTPFRSMIKYLIDKKEKRDIVLFYSNKTQDEIAYKEIFDQASREFGLKTIYTLSDETKLPSGWTGDKGFLTADKVKNLVPDFKERTFYLSGPHGMVAAFEKTLSQIGVPKIQIKTDYFPGF
jgi:ferredoxin-NADP reductase/Na+-translocating ferredoxin:NAD+ oxidoreductase RnfD subunit